MARVNVFTLYICVVLIFLPFIPFGCAGPAATEVVARVNNRDITSEELDEFMRIMYLCMPDLERVYSESGRIAALEEEMLWLLVEYKVLRQELARLSMEVDELEVEPNFQQLREDLITNIYKTEKAYLDRLQELRLAEDQLKTISRSALMRELLFQHVAGSVTEKDVRAYVQENPFLLEQPASAYAYRILLENEEEALRVRSLLEQGADFVETGEKYSNEGFVELGRIEKTDIFDPVFIEAAFALEPGELSPPVKTPQGYYLIKITDKEEAVTLEFEEARDEIMSVVQEEYYEKYFYRLLQNSKIETF